MKMFWHHLMNDKFGLRIKFGDFLPTLSHGLPHFGGIEFSILNEAKQWAAVSGVDCDGEHAFPIISKSCPAWCFGQLLLI